PTAPGLKSCAPEKGRKFDTPAALLRHCPRAVAGDILACLFRFRGKVMSQQQAPPAIGTPSIDGGLNLNSGNLILDGRSPPVPARVSISAAAGGSNVSLVTSQVQDNAGNNLGGVFPLVLWLSDTAANA